MADDFIVFLVAGLIIIAVLIAGFSLYNWIPSGEKCCESNDIADFAGALIVGPRDILTYTPFDMGHFEANFEQGTNIYTLGDQVIKNGVLFGNNNFKYHIQSLYVEDVKIRFTVAETNNYGQLVIKVNGNVAESRNFAKGEYTINVDKALLNDDVFVEIYAESSGLRIWAPDYYELSDIRLIVSGFTQNSFAYAFSAYDEYNMFNEGRIELNMAENAGEIVISINDMELYSGPVKTTESIKFSKDYLRYGQNYVKIFAKENAVLSGNAKMIIFHSMIHDARLEVPFSFNQTEYNKLKTGTITFDVVNIIKGGGISVKIVSNNQVTYNAYTTADAGSYDFTFEKANVRVGANLLMIDSVDGAIFAVKNVAVRA